MHPLGACVLYGFVNIEMIFFVQLTDLQHILLFRNGPLKTDSSYLFCKLGGFDLYKRCRHGLQVTALIVEGDTSRTWAQGEGGRMTRQDKYLTQLLSWQPETQVNFVELEWRLVAILVQFIPVHVAPSKYSSRNTLHPLQLQSFVSNHTLFFFIHLKKNVNENKNSK